MKVSVNKLMSLSIIVFFSYYSLLRLVGFVIPSGTIIILCLLFSIYIGIFFKSMKTEVPIDALFLLAFVGFYVVITYMLHPEYKPYLFERTNNVWRTIFTLNSSIWAYVVVRYFGDFNKVNVNKLLSIIATIVFLGNFWRPIEYLTYGYWITDASTGATRSYNMALGFELIIPAIIFYFLFRECKKKYYLVLSVTCMIEIVLFGSRSPILSLLIFICLYEIFIGKIYKNKKLLLLLMFLCVIVLFIYNSGFLEYLVEVLDEKGYEVRSLEVFLRDSAIDDSGRSKIWNNAIKYIVSDNWLFGYGIYGDQYHLGGQWCHNLFLEFCFDFGIILGLIISFSYIYISYKMIRRTNGNYQKLFIIFWSIAIGKLLVSNSYWFETYFWAALAICVNYKIYGVNNDESTI